MRDVETNPRACGVSFQGKNPDFEHPKSPGGKNYYPGRLLGRFGANRHKERLPFKHHAIVAGLSPGHGPRRGGGFPNVHALRTECHIIATLQGKSGNRVFFAIESASVLCKMAKLDSQEKI